MAANSSASETKNLSYSEIYEILESQSRPSTDYYVLMATASVIATFGLLLNSTAIIIGAMLVSPLMEPILGLSFASLIRNRTFTIRSAFTLVSGILLAICLSWVIGLFFSSVGTTAEIMARTKPNIMDLFVALAAGFLGAYVKIRRSVAGSIYGVAIAISLAPPLCVVGIGLAYLNNSIFLGALLLFLTNLGSIMLSSLLAFMLIDIPHNRMALRSFVIPLFAVIALSIPLVLSFKTLIDEKSLARELRYVLQSNTYTFHQLEIIDTELDLFRQPIQVTVTVRAHEADVTPRQVKLVEDYLETKMGKDIALTVNIAPLQQIRAE